MAIKKNVTTGLAILTLGIGGYLALCERQDYRSIDRSHPRVQELLDRQYLPGKERTEVSAFLDRLEAICYESNIHCHALLDVMSFETGGSFDPQRRNPMGSATGLIQFVENTAERLGTTTYKLSKMSALEQLPYVAKYFQIVCSDVRNSGRECDLSEPDNVALGVFYPGAMGRSEYIIGKKKKGGNRVSSEQRQIYRQNRRLDKNKDGIITDSEYAKMAINHGGFCRPSQKR